MSLMVALVMLVPGCATLRGGQTTPQPTSTPVPSPSQPTSTPDPTATASPGMDHPPGATDVVLRMESGGGLVPMGYFATQMPQFTLYGDGTAVFRPLPGKNALPFGAPTPPFLTGRMTPTDMDALLSYALHDGGLADAKSFYDYPNIADAGSTIFTIHAGGVDKQVSVYALMESAESGADQDDRDALGKLAERLNFFEDEARNGALDDVSDYDPDAYTVMLFDDTGQSPAEGVTPIGWPWPDIQLDDFEKSDARWATKTMTRSQTGKLTDVPNGGQMSIWVRTPNAEFAEFAVRPLLPEEIASASPAAS